MKCPKCNSENVQVQAKEFKPKAMGASCLMCAGIGLLFLGVIGAIFGLGIGFLIGSILNSIMANTYQSVMVCQECGYVSQPNDLLIPQPNRPLSYHPLFCDPDESNLDIIRNDLDKGTIVMIQVKIDENMPFTIRDNTTASLKVSEGVHIISYEQINGIGKKKNKGQLRVEMNDKQNITFSFTRRGLIVK